jgi:hypothetical protein
VAHGAWFVGYISQQVKLMGGAQYIEHVGLRNQIMFEAAIVGVSALAALTLLFPATKSIAAMLAALVAGVFSLLLLGMLFQLGFVHQFLPGSFGFQKAPVALGAALGIVTWFLSRDRRARSDTATQDRDGHTQPSSASGV